MRIPYELPPLPPGWSELEPATRTPGFAALRQFLAEDSKTHTLYPPAANVFNALALTPLDSVRVLILGQDPYHGDGQAHGLAFSVPHGVAVPASLRNIFKELSSDVGFVAPGHGNLSEWSGRGVLLLNAVLTVRAGEAGSHRGRGWEAFTDSVIGLVNGRGHRVVFLLLGAWAQGKASLIDSSRHDIVMAAHPSPLSAYRGFLGSRVFSRVGGDWGLERVERTGPGGGEV